MKKVLTGALILCLCLAIIIPTSALYTKSDDLPPVDITARTFSFGLSQSGNGSFTAAVSPQNSTYVYSFFVSAVDPSYLTITPQYNAVYSELISLTLTKKVDGVAVPIEYKNGKFSDSVIFGESEVRLYTLTVSAPNAESAYDVATSITLSGSETGGDFTIVPGEILKNYTTDIKYVISKTATALAVTASYNGQNITNWLNYNFSGSNLTSVEPKDEYAANLDASTVIYITVTIPETREEGDVVSVGGDMTITTTTTTDIKDITSTGTITVTANGNTNLDTITAEKVVIDASKDIVLNEVVAETVSITANGGVSLTLNACQIDNFTSDGCGSVDIVANGGSVTNTSLTTNGGTPISITSATIDGLTISGGKAVTLNTDGEMKNVNITVDNSVAIDLTAGSIDGLTVSGGKNVTVNTSGDLKNAAVASNNNVTFTCGSFENLTASTPKILTLRGDTIKSAYLNPTNGGANLDVSVATIDFIELKGSGHASITASGDISNITTNGTFTTSNGSPLIISSNSIKSADLHVAYITMNLVEKYDANNTVTGENKFTLLDINGNPINLAATSSASCDFTSDESSLNEIKISLTSNQWNSRLQINDVN